MHKIYVADVTGSVKITVSSHLRTWSRTGLSSFVYLWTIIFPLLSQSKNPAFSFPHFHVHFTFSCSYKTSLESNISYVSIPSLTPVNQYQPLHEQASSTLFYYKPPMHLSSFFPQNSLYLFYFNSHTSFFDFSEKCENVICSLVGIRNQYIRP